MEKEIILSLKNIRKEYPGVLAVNDLSLDIKKGSVHALIGENGAGKSTVIKMCCGAIKPTSGKITICGEEYTKMTPQTARKKGIQVIYQEFNLLSEQSVSENIFMGDFIRKGVLIDKKKMIKKTREIFEILNLKVDPNEQVKNLSVGYQQMVEIAKALSHDVKLLIMDEPSAPLTNNEVELMFEMVQKLVDSGVTVIYISHRLEEIFRIADRVTIMRDGNLIETKDVKDTNKDELIRAMVGREIKSGSFIREINKDAEPILEVRGLTGNGVKNVTFSLKQGEILGFGGLMGAGRTELAEILFGVKRFTSGEILYKGNGVQFKHPSKAIKKGIALIPEDRKRQGVFLEMSILDNVIYPSLKRISKYSVVKQKVAIGIADKYIDELLIKTPSRQQTTKNLSGGNQQKVVLAKWLATEPELLIFDEPTRGIDVGAKQEIYTLMDRLVKEGKTIIMISSEMEELFEMSDRIIVLCEGRATGELSREEFDQETVLRMASKVISED